MGYVYKRGKKYGIAIEDEDGQEVRRIIGTSRGEAEATLQEVEKAMAEPYQPSPDALKEVTDRWLARRQRIGQRTSANYRSYLVHHILPFLGELPVQEIRVRDIRDFIGHLEGKELAPRTVRNIYACLRKLFNDLVVDEVITATPCVLSKEHLPRNEDANPEWRAGAYFSAEEVQLLLKGDLPDSGRTVNLGARRVIYALGFYTGCRIGEILALRWRHIEKKKPLDKLLVSTSTTGRTKTRVTRQVPVHPELARMLKEWWEGGWEAYEGRAPKAEDLIVPNYDGLHLSMSTILGRLRRDLDFLELRYRRLHDTRRTFISQILEGGARRDVVRRMTHTSTKDMIDMYTSIRWEEMCKAMECLSYEG